MRKVAPFMPPQKTLGPLFSSKLPRPLVFPFHELSKVLLFGPERSLHFRSAGLRPGAKRNILIAPGRRPALRTYFAPGRRPALRTLAATLRRRALSRINPVASSWL